MCAAATFAVFSSCGDPTDNGGTEPSVPSVSSYTVTFNANGGSAVDPQTVKAGEKVTEPQAPTKAEHIFTGWYKDAAFNTQWNFATDVVLGNLTLYAEWVDQNTSFYTVTFNAEGGTPEPEQQSIVENRKAQQPENPTKAGHIFDGWYTDATDEETRWNFAVDTVTSNTALYAKWAEAFTVTFDSNGGSAVPTLTRAAGEYVYLDGYRSATAKSGYIFDGWYTDQA
ncbi:MAG: InlB B-repeat-containing protein, partial [Treponema sp.]|nr:InlB B-repeat-containing protein [Treponema sp.]